MLRKSLFLFTAAFIFSIQPSVAQESTPDAVITGALEAVQAGLAGQREALEADEAKLIEFVDGLLAPRFDRNYAGRLVLARHWRGASADQKRRFIDGFYQAMLKRYATGVLEFQEDRIEILPSRGEQKGNRANVRTIVTLDNGESVPVNYGLVNRKDVGWKVYDVTIEGISYIRNFRTEIDSEIKKSSLDDVIARFEAEAVGNDG
ncbi:MAG: ABC transporter substrate-binding protein [Pseudomonadota bacterium]